MSFLSKICYAVATVREGLRRFGCMYGIGGPVGVYHALKIAHGKHRMARLAECIDHEKDLHRENLRTLNYELTQAIAEHNGNTSAAAQFWLWCEKKAGVL